MFRTMTLDARARLLGIVAIAFAETGCVPEMRTFLSDAPDLAQPDDADDEPSPDLSSDPYCPLTRPGCFADVCASGNCQPHIIAWGQSGLSEIAVSADTIYWLGDNGLRSCPLSGCNNQYVTLASGMMLRRGLVLDPSNVYWTEAGNQSSRVARCAVGGCAMTPTVLWQSGAETAGPLAVDAANIYFGTVATLTPSIGRVIQCPLSGCMSSGVALASARLPSALALDGGNVYWANADETLPAVERCAIGGCGNQPTAVTSMPGGGAAQLLLEGGYAFWTSRPSPSQPPTDVVSCQESQCMFPDGLFTLGGAVKMVSDGVYVFGIAEGSSVIGQCGIGGCRQSPTPIGDGLNDPIALAVDATNIYIADRLDGIIYSIGR